MNQEDFALIRGTTAGDLGSVIDVARESVVDVREIDPEKLYLAVVSERSREQVLDLEGHLPRPRRKVGTVRFHTGDSFSAYVNRHAVPSADEDLNKATLWGDLEQARIVAVLDDHEPHAAGWGEHRAVLQLRHTAAWKRWAAKHRQMMPQRDFAELVEEGLEDIVEPPAAGMLEVAQSLQAAKSVAFRSGTRLQDGQVQLVWEETIEAKAGQKGDLTIPEVFVLALCPYEGSDPFRVRARLRWRINDGALLMGYVLDRPEDVLEAAFTDMKDRVEAETGIPVWAGVPR